MKLEEIKKNKDHIDFFNTKEVNVIFDVSGSQNYDFELIKEYYFPKQNIKYHFIFCDHTVCSYHQVDIKNLFLGNLGGGGTLIQKGIDYIINNINNDNNLLIITDGYTDHMNFDKYNGEILVISDSISIRELFYQYPERVKNILLDNNDN